MVMFNSYVKLPEGNFHEEICLFLPQLKLSFRMLWRFSSQLFIFFADILGSRFYLLRTSLI